MKILTVDDSATMRRIIMSTLSRLGYDDLVEAENGIDGLGKMEGVELVLTDWNMPEMDGLTFVKRLRENPAYREVSIIMITTETDRNEILDAVEAGVDDYIVKPLAPHILKEKLEKVLKG